MAKKKQSKRSSASTNAKGASKTVRLQFRPPEHPNVTLSDWLVVHANDTDIVTNIEREATQWRIQVEKT